MHVSESMPNSATQPLRAKGWGLGGGGGLFNISLSVSAFHFYDPLANCCEVSIIFLGCDSKFCSIFISYTWKLFGKYTVCNSKSLYVGGFNDQGDTNNFLFEQNRKPQLYFENSSEIPTRHIICIPCQWCNIIPHCERVSNFSLCESESEQGSYSLPDNCQNNSR